MLERGAQNIDREIESRIYIYINRYRVSVQYIDTDIYRYGSTQD